MLAYKFLQIMETTQSINLMVETNMKYLMYCAIIFLSSICFAQEIRTFNTSDGAVNLDMLSSKLSQKLSARVSNANLRSSYNPMVWLFNAVSDSGIHYVLSFDVETSASLKFQINCNAIMTGHNSTIFPANIIISDCESTPEASISFFDSIKYEDVGIPVHRIGKKY